MGSKMKIKQSHTKGKKYSGRNMERIKKMIPISKKAFRRKGFIFILNRERFFLGRMFWKNSESSIRAGITVAKAIKYPIHLSRVFSGRFKYIQFFKEIFMISKASQTETENKAV
jgi:hypothetical protein